MLKKFKLSQSKRAKPVMKGPRLALPAAESEKYERQLRALVSRMTAETNYQIEKLFRSETFKEFRASQKEAAAMDASPASQARIVTNELFQRFSILFGEQAKTLAEGMLRGTLSASKRALGNSLKTLSGGLTINTGLIPSGLREVGKAIVSENIGLIKSIPAEYMQKVQGSVMRAITTGGDVGRITNDLKKADGMTERRAKNIALDQTRKSYNAINQQRMQAVGVKKFEWLHSGGGLQPREDHIAMNGNIYSFDDLPVIDEKTGETGIPGQAINCKCTMAPVFEFDDEG